MHKINKIFIPHRNKRGSALSSTEAFKSKHPRLTVPTYPIQVGKEYYDLPLSKAGYPLTWDLHPITNSWISCFYPPITNIYWHKNLTLYHIYWLIKSNVFKEITSQLRLIKDKEQRDEFKNSKFCSCCFAGVFSRRADNSLIVHSGLICIDIDSVSGQLQHVRESLNGLPHTVMSFISPTGNGIKAIFRHNPQVEYSEFYHYLSVYISRTCNLPYRNIDFSCKNLSRSCFLPHDPQCFINPNLLPNE